MKNRLRILYLASEVAPFAKTGGLADVASALPKALFEMGHDVRVIMPKYGSINDRRYILRDVIRLKKIPVKMGDQSYAVSAKSAFIPDTKVQVYFLDHSGLFGRSELYVDKKTNKDYKDNAERFALFARAVLATIKLLHWEPDVIHCNDWQTGLVPWLLKNEFKRDSFLTNTATMFSVHNLAYQGNFNPEILPKIGLPAELEKTGSDAEFYGQISFMKIGIMNADIITTVSPSYAVEIQTNEELASGFQDILRSRKKDIFGILNGVDYKVWNPETDSTIAENYSVADLQGKLGNKKALLQKCDLEFNENIPTMGMISRLVEQKGFDLLVQAIDEIIDMDVQLVILGIGDSKYSEFLKDIQKKYPDQFCFISKFDDELAHLIEAGCDIFLMPSRYEPCGLNQLYSLKYGTIPIVHKTGGLADSVIDYTTNNQKGYGFSFEAYTSNGLTGAIQRAVQEYRNEKEWQKIIKRAMKLDFSWKNAAEKYIKLYNKLK
jgi:starch synthase